jgi:hypothetical protein
MSLGNIIIQLYRSKLLEISAIFAESLKFGLVSGAPLELTLRKSYHSEP